VQALREKDCAEVFVVRSCDYDLTREENVTRLFEDTHPDLVIHLAGLVGGILANKERPAEFFYHNLTMGTLVFHYAWKYGVEKLLAAAAGCGYPEHAPMPLKEESFWDGFPQWESAPYSLAKRMLHIQSIAYQRQYGFVSIVAIPGNLYGPYDNFNLQDAHVIPALVRKFVEATDRGDDEVVVWGTGKPTRDFVYAGDVAKFMLKALEVYDHSTLANISSGVESSIRQVTEILAEVTGFEGEVMWDTSRPDGQVRRVFDMTRAKEELAFEPETTLREGLQRTVEWYRQNQHSEGIRK
jgi:GDP-L-fucose synthase